MHHLFCMDMNMTLGLTNHVNWFCCKKQQRFPLLAMINHPHLMGFRTLMITLWHLINCGSTIQESKKQVYLLICSFRVSQCAKSMKNYTLSPDSRFLCQIHYKKANNNHFEAFLGVAHPLRNLSTIVFNRNFEKSYFCLKITLPKVQMVWTFNIFEY